MKPREFDDLVRDKFDQGDFAYNPRNWERLADQMDDGRKKKRGIVAWLGLPLAGMAASVALAMGVTTVLRMGVPDTHGAGKASHNSQVVAMAAPAVPQVLPAETAKNAEANTSSTQKLVQRSAKPVAVRNHSNTISKPADNSGGFHIKLGDKAYVQATPSNVYNAAAGINSAGINSINHNSEISKNKQTQPQNRRKIVLVDEGYNTFKEEPTNKRPANLSIILSGGVNRGNKNSGYMAGATVRHMISDRVYVEGDVAFTSSSNTQMTSYEETITTVSKTDTKIGKESVAKVTGEGLPAEPEPYISPTVVRHKDVSYNMYYAQVSPSVGYKIMNRMSVGAGPDFQKALADNRPAQSTAERGTIQVAPLFDIGFVGKTEYAITKQVKAAVYYRKGINNVITPMGKYIDRDYLQFQVKCAIFNK